MSFYFTIFGVALLIFWAQSNSQNYFCQIREKPRPGRERYGRYDDEGDEDDDDGDYDPLPPRGPRRYRKSSVQLD